MGMQEKLSRRRMLQTAVGVGAGLVFASTLGCESSEQKEWIKRWVEWEPGETAYILNAQLAIGPKTWRQKSRVHGELALKAGNAYTLENDEVEVVQSPILTREGQGPEVFPFGQYGSEVFGNLWITYFSPKYQNPVFMLFIPGRSTLTPDIQLLDRTIHHLDGTSDKNPTLDKVRPGELLLNGLVDPITVSEAPKVTEGSRTQPHIHYQDNDGNSVRVAYATIAKRDQILK